MKPSIVLVFRFSAMGDVAIAAAAMREVAAQNSNIKFVVVTNALFEPFFDGISGVTVFPARFKTEYKGIFGLFKLYRQLGKTYAITQIADLHNVLRTKVLRFLFYFSGIKIRVIRKDRKLKRQLCKTGAKILTPLKPSSERYAEVFQKLGLNATLAHQPVILKSELSGKIGISPFAQHQAKIYPLHLMEQVVEELSKNYTLYLFGGGAKEQEICETWAAQYPQTVSMVGKIKLKEELEFMKTLDLMLSMDSSGMHLASLAQIPALSVWGGTHPFLGFVGYGQENQPQIQSLRACRPCSVYGEKACRFQNYPCLTDISPEFIVKTVHEFLCRI